MESSPSKSVLFCQQFTINNSISIEERKQTLKLMFMYFGEICQKCVHYIEIHFFCFVYKAINTKISR